MHRTAEFALLVKIHLVPADTQKTRRLHARRSAADDTDALNPGDGIDVADSRHIALGIHRTAQTACMSEFVYRSNAALRAANARHDIFRTAFGKRHRPQRIGDDRTAQADIVANPVFQRLFRNIGGGESTVQDQRHLDTRILECLGDSDEITTTIVLGVDAADIAFVSTDDMEANDSRLLQDLRLFHALFQGQAILAELATRQTGDDREIASALFPHFFDDLAIEAHTVFGIPAIFVRTAVVER